MMTKKEDIDKVFFPLERKLSYDTEFRITFGKDANIKKAVKLVKTHLMEAAEKDPKKGDIGNSIRLMLKCLV